MSVKGKEHMYNIIRPSSLFVVVFVALTASVLAQDVTGTWKAMVELTIGAGEPTFVFEQNDGQVTGTYAGTFGGADLTGAVTGDTIEFFFEVPMAGTVTYTGTISGNTMEGTCDYGQIGGGTWEAKRVQ